jgi:hypothetical protein
MPADSSLAIAVFARAPVPGRAKTRLIPLLGAEGAARLQANLIDIALVKACAAGAQVTLWVAGDPDSVAHLARRHGVPLVPQQGEDLGARMAHAFAATLATPGTARCVLIGTDCPALTSADLVAAGHLLLDHDVAIVPALDGGYVLIALAAPQPRLFESIPWGGADVMSATRERIVACGLHSVELPPLPDLDTPEDYACARAAGWLAAD